MKGFNFNSTFNYSKVGKISAKLFSNIINRDEKIKKILKGKNYKSVIEKDYLDEEVKESFEEDKNFNNEDIFDENYNEQYNEKLVFQKRKYFDYIKSCAFNKTLYKENKEGNKDINKNIKLINPKFKKKKYYIIENIPNKDFIYKKIYYSQSFDKMIGRYDYEKKKQRIEEMLESLNKKKIQNKKDKEKSKKLDKNEENNLTEEENEEIVKNNNSKTFYMNRTPQKGKMKYRRDAEFRTTQTKGINLKKKNPHFYKKLSLFSLNNDNNKFSIRKNNRFFSSLNSLHKNNILINDNKKNNDESSVLDQKRVFSGLNKKNEKMNHNDSIPSNILIDKSPKKELSFIYKLKKRKRIFSSKDINNSRKNILNDKNNSNISNSMNKTNINFDRKKSKNNSLLLKTHQVESSQNNGLSFKNMLSRDYVNRIHINNRIGAGMPYSPKYSSIFPKVINSVNYSLKHNFNRKSKLRDIGINIEENNKNGHLNPNINFSKMFVRDDGNSKYPLHMNKVNSRNAFNFITAKSLKMSHYSKRKLNSPKSSFNTKKSFNSNLDNINSKIIHNSIENIKEMREKENRINNYKNNIENIFRKIIFDKIIEKNEINGVAFDMKKNSKLRKQINSSYKKLFSDYYKMNLDIFEKNYTKKKIDGITFKEIKNNNKVN